MRLAPRPKREADDGIVPLINIVFLLLIFFLIAGTIAPRPEIAVAYPETKESPVSRPPAEAVFVSSGGYISYRGANVETEGLTAMVAADLAARAPGRDDTPLPVVVDKALPAKDLSPVLNALTVAGVKRVKLITVRKRGGQT